MARFLSPEWVDAFNGALADLLLDPAVLAASIAAASGSFAVEQVVHDVPTLDGSGEPDTIRTRLVAEDGHLSMALVDPAVESTADVVISLAYPDAAAIARGDMDAARALGEGQIRIRGDLAVLTAVQGLLAAAGEQLTGLRATTTY